MSADLLNNLRLGARFDLHLHSSRSDGAFSTEEVLQRCASARLDVIAITDHDLPPDLRPGEHLVQGRQLRVIGLAARSSRSSTTSAFRS